MDNLCIHTALPLILARSFTWAQCSTALWDSCSLSPLQPNSIPDRFSGNPLCIILFNFSSVPQEDANEYSSHIAAAAIEENSKLVITESRASIACPKFDKNNMSPASEIQRLRGSVWLERSSHKVTSLSMNLVVQKSRVRIYRFAIIHSIQNLPNEKLAPRGYFNPLYFHPHSRKAPKFYVRCDPSKGKALNKWKSLHPLLRRWRLDVLYEISSLHELLLLRIESSTE